MFGTDNRINPVKSTTGVTAREKGSKKKEPNAGPHEILMGERESPHATEQLPKKIKHFPLAILFAKID